MQPLPLRLLPKLKESGCTVESQQSLWGHHKGGKDSDTMMLAAATKMKAIAPDTKIYIYRNLAQAYSNFVQVNSTSDSRLICRAVRLANPTSLSQTTRGFPSTKAAILASRRCTRLRAS